MAANKHTYVPEDKNQALVTTPYGRGLVIRSNRDDGIKEVQLTEWEMASQRRGVPPNAMLYTPQVFPSVKPLLGDHITCTWGRGKVLAIAGRKITVELSSWRLANRCTVKCYLDMEAIQVVRKKTQAEMDVYERVELAKELKARASKQFGHKLYDAALLTYAKAVESVRYVQHDATSSNEVRADLIIVMITCCNNAGTCSMSLKKWEECIKYGKNALVLLDALDLKRGLRIHTILNKDGYSDQKLFGEWRIKSHLLIARGNFEKKEFDEALKAIGIAASLLESEQSKSTTLLSQEKELNKLKAHCVREKKVIAKKEKKRAQAMFGGGATAAKSPKNNDTARKTKEVLEPKVSPTVVKPAIRPSKPVNGMIRAREGVADDSPKNMKKSVSFSNPEALEYDEGEDEEEDGLPWYEEHMEAFVLVAGVCLIAAAVSLMLRTNSKKQ